MAVAERAELTLLLATVKMAVVVVHLLMAAARQQVGMVDLRAAVVRFVTQPALLLRQAMVDRLQAAVRQLARRLLGSKQVVALELVREAVEL